MSADLNNDLWAGKPKWADLPTALYRHWCAGDKLLYVGVSCNPVHRAGTHRVRAAWAPEIVKITLEWYPNRSAALQAELVAIQQECPVHNVREAGPGARNKKVQRKHWSPDPRFA